MESTGNRTSGVRRAVVALLAALLLGLGLAPNGANAAKVDNPSPPNFRTEITGGFLEVIGTSGTALGIPMDFASFDLPNPALAGSVTTNAQGYGVINIPNTTYPNCVPSQTPAGGGICFPPIPVNVDDVAVTVRIQPVAAFTGFIDPLSGTVQLNMPLRLKLEGAALGVDLGSGCYVGNSGSPITLAMKTHVGAFPTTSPAPTQPVAVADFTANDAGYIAGQPYSDESGVWPAAPVEAPGFTPGTLPKPTVDQIPLNPLTDFIPRAEGAWRGVDETLIARAAEGCGLATSVVNGDLIGLPSSGNNTASIDFKFTQFPQRPNAADAIVKKAVKSRFVAPGVSNSPWLTTETPTAVSAQTVNLDASTSYFKVGGHASERYSFDFGTGNFGSWSTSPTTSFTAPTIPEGSPPSNLAIKVRVKDSQGDIDISTRTLRVVPATDISLDAEATSVAGVGNLRGGSVGHLTLDVKNNSTNDASSLPLTLTASTPSGVSITNLDSPGAWNCSNDASTINCTLPANGLAAGATSSFDATVDVDTGATSPASINANVAMAGDPAPSNNTDNLSVPVRKTDLTVSVNREEDLVANGWFAYDIDVENAGDGLTVGGSTVEVTLPSDLSIRTQDLVDGGWNCNVVDPQHLTCTLADAIDGNSSAPLITVWAKVAANAPAEDRTVTATVSTQGDIDAFGGSNSGSDTGMVQILNDLAVDVDVAGDYVVGDPGTITYSVTNESVVPGTVATQIDSALPAGITVDAVEGTGWDCSATVLGTDSIHCDLAAGLNASESSAPVTATVSVAQAAYPGITVPVDLSNSEDAFELNNTDAAEVQVRRLDVAIEKIAVRPFNVGIEGRYRLNVTNVGDAATVGDITVTDTLPAGLEIRGVSGAGWDCANSVVGGQDAVCVMENELGAGIQAAPIEVRVEVLDEAAEAGTVENTAYVDTPRDTRGVPEDAAVEGNNSSTVITTAVAVDLSIASQHQGAFRVGTDDVYSLDIRNVGFFGTDPGEPITVTDDLPDGIVPDVDGIEVTRPGWVCGEDEGDVTCSLDAPDEFTSAMDPETAVTIDIPVLITDDAADVSENVAEVSTARDDNPALSPNNIATDPTEVKRIDLAVDGEVTIAPRAGGIGEVEIVAHNGGSAATVEPTTVVLPLSTGVAFRPTGSTTAGWSCSSLGVGTQISCVRSQSIAADGDAPVLKLQTNVGPTALASWDSVVTVATNGEPATRLADNEDSVSHTLETIDLGISKSHDPAAVRAGKRASFKIHVENVGNTATVATYRVQDSVNPAFQNVSANGAGWNCSVTGNDVDFRTRHGSLDAGDPAPDITVSFDIPGTASGSKDSTATVSSTDDPFTANNSASDPISIVATADVTVTIDQPGTMRVGDTVGISYNVRNIGTDSSAGAPSVKLNVSASEGLRPIGTTGDGDWTCDTVEATGSDPAFLACEYGGTIAPGADTTIIGQFEVVPTSASQAQTLALATTPGDVNSSNNFANATSTLSGVDLEATVAPDSESTEHMEAGVNATRVVTVENVGTSTTTGPIQVSVDLPEGVQWDSGVGAGSGWSCGQLARKVTCQRSDQLTVGQAAPGLNLALRASRSNAPSVAISYVVSTTGDENINNDTATRTEEVRYNPDTVITSGPSDSTSKSGSVEFNSPDSNVTFECAVDVNPFEACVSPFSVDGLSIGEHSIQVRAVNGHGMADDSPAVASWEILSVPKEPPFAPVTLESTGGTLSLASLGSVDLPENQVKLDGQISVNSGGVTIPTEGVAFAPVIQTIPDVLGPGSEVGVSINISATSPGDGLLPNGGGDASFVLPVRADVVATLNGSPLLPEGTECALKPVTFDLAGTYDEAAGTLHLEQNNVAFPSITGCGSFKGTIDTLLELPRNDIQMALDFKVTKGSAECEPPLIGTPPDCIMPSEPVPNLAKVVLKAPKKIKSGKKFQIRALVKNTGDGDAANVKVCLRTPKKRIFGKARRCRTIKSVAAGKTGRAVFKVRARKAAKKAPRRMKVVYTVIAPVGDGAATGKRRGHVTVLK